MATACLNLDDFMPKLKLTVIYMLLVFSCLFVERLEAQDSSHLDHLILLPDKFFGALDKKTSSIESKLDKQTIKYLSKLQKQENKLKKRLYKKDSLLAKQLFEGVNDKYNQLKNATWKVNKYESVYSGHLDSLSTALAFLKNNNVSNLSSNPELQKTLSQYQELQNRLNTSEQINKYLSQRQQLLKDQFEKLGMVKELKQFKKQVYYYQAQVKKYKQAFADPSKVEAILMEVVMKIPEFKSFFANNSMLGSLFPLPGSTNASSVILQGLQTRSMINQSLVDRFGSGPNVTQQLQQNIQAAQGQLNELKNKLSQYSIGSISNSGNSDQAMPDFKPNSQKTKSFFKRLEYGTNVQSQKARYFFPVTSDLGLSLGYKLNDKSVVGVGASYKVGWGSSWNNIQISHQGVGLRSYLDWKIKGSFYLSGGYEQNYRSLIQIIDQLKGYSGWQSSGLVGLSKKYQVSKKLKGEMKLLWDFLSYKQVPRTQAILFRVGYNFK